MPVFDHPDFDHHQQVVHGYDAASGLRAIIAIHDTTRGPALGGLRIYPYASEADALTDVLRLSRGMTYKSALADLPLGGGKAVIIADPRRGKSPERLRAMGRLIDSLGGRYITAEDAGSDEADMRVIAEVTEHVGGLGRDGASGDPSPWTALGVFHAMQSAVYHGLGRAESEHQFDGLRVAIQGVGHVGGHLARRLHDAGARLVLADLDRDAAARLAEELDADTVAPEAIVDAEVDVFAPCAMGAALTPEVVRRLEARVVCGAANNQLASPEVADRLLARGILYTPDYVANAGGVIEIAWQRRADARPEAVMAHIARIGTTLDEIFARAAREGRSPALIADDLARERFEAADRRSVS